MARTRPMTAEEVELPPRDDTTVQLLDGDGKPLTDKMTTEEFSRRAEAVTRDLQGSNQPEGGDELRNLVQRIEKLEDDRAAVNADLREVYAEAHGAGYMVKVLRLVVRRRKRARDEIHAEDELVTMYEDMLT